MVCVALAFVAAAWSETFAPAARSSDGFIAARAGSGQYVVTEIAPRYVRDPLGPRVGDVFDPARETWIELARFLNGADDGLTAQVTRGHAIATIHITVAADEIASRNLPQYLATGFEATLAIVIGAFLLLYRPSPATAALFFYGCASIDTSPVVRQLGMLPDPAFAVIAFVLLAAFYELPAFALLIFLTRFPTLPSTPGARARMRIGDAIFAGAAVACAALTLQHPSTVGADRNALALAGTLLGLVFAALAYRDATGESRQRISWVIVGLAVTDVAYLLYALMSTSRWGLDLPWIAAAFDVATLALPVSLAYAVWRHRVLDIAFALNRAAVFTATSAILVGVFGGLQWAANALIVRATHPQSFFIQLAIAVVILYVFRVARTSVEAFVSHTLFAGRRRRIDRIGAIADEVDALSNADDVAPCVERGLAGIGITAALRFGDDVRHLGPTPGAERLRTFELRVRGRLRGVLAVWAAAGEGDLAPDEADALRGLATRIVIARDDMLAEALKRDLAWAGAPS